MSSRIIETDSPILAPLRGMGLFYLSIRSALPRRQARIQTEYRAIGKMAL